jgi:hypothetical protein
MEIEEIAGEVVGSGYKIYAESRTDLLENCLVKVHLAFPREDAKK